MPDLADFLQARIAEDKDTAKRAAFRRGATWRDETDDEWSVVHADGERDMVGSEDDDVTRHIARHDPARVLADCDAKQELLALADPYDFADDGGTGMSEHAEKIRRLLALPYATHPDYRPEWTPDA